MKFVVVAISFGIGVLSISSVQARDVDVSLMGGTSGLGVHLSAPITTNLNGRIGVNYARITGNQTISDVNYDYKLTGQTLDALLDYYPSGSDFRISAGIILNGNKATYTARPAEGNTFYFGNGSYTSDNFGTANGRTDFRKAAPYLGIGWGKNLTKAKGWSFSADVGVMFQGAPKTSLTASNCNLGEIGCTLLQENLNREAAAVNEETRSYRYFPVVRVGAVYKF